MQAVIDDANAIYVTDDGPTAEPRYRARFYFDPNSIPMASGDAHYIFKGFMGASTEVLRVEFRQSAGTYQIRASLLDDGTTFINSSFFTISDAPHFVEVDWRAATAPGANNGGLTLWIDGIQQADLSRSGQRYLADRSCSAGSTDRDRHRHTRHLLLRCLRVAQAKLYWTIIWRCWLRENRHQELKWCLFSSYQWS